MDKLLHLQKGSSLINEEQQISTFSHSLKIFTDSDSIFFKVIFLLYQKGALPVFENFVSLTSAFITCQKPYLRSKEQFFTSISLASFKGDSPSAGPENLQSSIIPLVRLYKHLSSSKTLFLTVVLFSW